MSKSAVLTLLTIVLPCTILAGRCRRQEPPSVAVFPFANMSGAKEDDYLCEGPAVEIITALTRVPGRRARIDYFGECHRTDGSRRHFARKGEYSRVQTEHKLTMRSFVMGSVLAVVLCGVNSYLTLSFGIIEEGPAIAALFFFAFFFRSRNKITSTEMVIVATMGSAGGSLGFISNFYAAKVMATGEPYSIVDMALFSIVSSIVGLIAVILLRQLLIVQDEKLPEGQRLPWVGARAVKGVIDPLVTTSSSNQPLILVICTCAAILYVIFNADGVGWVPAEVMIGFFGLSAFGAGIAFSPFVWGGSYLIGFRTCVGFFIGGVVLLVMAPHLPDPASPHRYVWPGVMFLVTSGLTALLLRWRVIVAALRSIFGKMSGDDDPIMGKTGTALFVTAGLAVSISVLHFYFGLSLLIVGAMVVIGGILLNLISCRAAAQTYFSPSRVMGILLQGVCALLGGSSVNTNITGAGFIAGSDSQSGNLTNDMAYGRWFGVFSRWQFWTQASTVVACSFVSAVVFKLIHMNTPLTLEGGELSAPIAKIWAAIGLMFDPKSGQELPPFAVESMWIAGAAGVVWAWLEDRPGARRFLPGSIGFGIGLILPVVYDFAFFCGSMMMFYVFGRLLKFKDISLNTIAVACIVGEGIGGILQALLKILGVIAR